LIRLAEWFRIETILILSLIFDFSMPGSRSIPSSKANGADGSRTIALGRLLAGQSAVVSRIVGRGEDVQRLEEFGLRSGTTVEMFRPGNPCILRLAGNKVCLRIQRSLAVFVAPLPIPP
jgi:Fe2+ transport system protein FeoA